MSKVGIFAGGPSLPPQALRVSRALAEALFDDGTPVSAQRLDRFEADLREFCRFCGTKTRVALRASIAIHQYAPLWVLGTPRRFTALSREERRRFLEKAETRSLPLAFQGLKTIFAILWYELNPDQLPEMVRREPRAGAAFAALRRKA